MSRLSMFSVDCEDEECFDESFGRIHVCDCVGSSGKGRLRSIAVSTRFIILNRDDTEIQ